MNNNIILIAILSVLVAATFVTQAQAGPGPRPAPAVKAVQVDTTPAVQIGLACGNCGIESVTVPRKKEVSVQRSNGHGQLRGAITNEYDDEQIAARIEKLY